MKKFFTLMLMAMLSMVVMAEKELYGVLESGTLTIYYDEDRAANSGVLEWWNDDAIKAATTTVKFDASVATARPTSTAGWFNGFELLSTITDMDLLNTEDVTTMAEMFSGCKLLTSLDFSTHNTSKVTNMYCMFYHCDALTYLNVGFDTQNVTDMSWMFCHCDALPSLNVTGFDTHSVTDMSGMFADCYELTSLDLSSFNTEKVTVMYALFRDCWKLEEVNLSSFDTKNVTNMGDMFWDCFALKSTALKPLGVNVFDTRKVTRMFRMFDYCKTIEYLDLTSFNTENVESMGYMFSNCSNLVTIDGLYTFNTGKVTDMSYMFSNCKKIEFGSDDFLYFNTRNVTNMASMFQNCSAVTELDLRSFSMSKVENTKRMFIGCSNLSVIICSDDWSAYENITSSDDMFKDCDLLHGGAYTPTIYDAGNPNDISYAHVDEGTSNPGYFTEGPMELYTVYDPETKVLTYHYDVNRPKHDGIVDLVSNKLNYSKYYDEAEKVVIEPAVQMKSLTDMEYFFGGVVGIGDKSLENVKKIEGLEYINTSDITSYNYMFWNMLSLDSLDLSSFDVDNATSMRSMFGGCSSLKYVNLSSFNKSGKVTDFDYMFSNCESLESLDVRMLDTHSATTMAYMFNYCTSLKALDLSYFNTDGVTTMNDMFYCCWALETLALDRFSSASLTNVDDMFYGCTNLKTIWWPIDISGIPSSDNMFHGCTSLVGSKGTEFDAGHVDGAYAHLDGGSGDEGYFSERGSEPMMYTVYNPVSRTLFFNYDADFYSTPYNPGSSIPELVEDKVLFRDYCNEIENAVFNISFAAARPTHGGDLFHQFERDKEGNIFFAHAASNITTILDFDFVNTEEMTDMSYMFYGIDDIDLSTIDFSTFNTDKVTDMSHMFEYAGSMTKIDLSNFNTENVTNMNSMFDECFAITSLDVSMFDTKNVTDMSWMFNGCSELKGLDVTDFNTSNVTDMAVMFGGCYNLTALDVTKFDTKKVENMSNMFAGCSGLTSLDVSKLNTELVRDMSFMFGGCTGLTELDVTAFKTDSVRDMGGMFSDCSELTSLDLSSFHTDSVERMPYMFQMCSKLESVDLSSFNAGKVVSMENMFYGCSALKQLDLSSFHTDSIHYATGMFSNCTALEKIDLSTFHAPKLENASYMFYSCPKLTRLDLSAFESKDIRDMNYMFAECSELKYIDIASFGRQRLYSVFSAFENCAKLDTIVCNDNWKLTKTLVDEIYTSGRIFAGCDVLRGPLGSTTADYAVDLADDYVHINYAHVDEGVSKPGFFTPKFKVLFVDADESELKTEYVVYGHAATEPATKPTKEGYHFVEWDTDFSSVKDNLTIKPKFEINTYKVEFIESHGAITSDPEITDYEHVEHGSEFVLTATPADGYELDSWTNYDGVKLVVTSDTTVTATFKLKEYKVTFVAEHGTITSDPEIADMDHVKHGSEFVLTATPDEGYVLNEWINYDESKLYVTSDTTVTATFKLQTFDVKFLDINGDQIGATQVVEWGHDAVAPEAPEVEGYTFQGWNASFVNVKANITVEAIYAINEYKLTFVAEHGSIASDPVVADLNKVEHGTELVLTATPDEGYDFDEWTNYNGMKLVVTSDTTVTAAFKLKTFTVKFEDWDGTQIGESQIVEWGSAATAPEEPTREGWTFAGWNKAFNVVKSDLTVTATYTKNPVYTVTFIDYDESVIAEVKVEEGKDAVAPDDPIREGYHFTGWDKAFDNVTADLTVMAKYAINTYTVTFLGFEDVKLGEQVVEHGQDAPGVMAPVVDGYVFKGWDTDYTKVTKDLTVKAIYEKDLTPKNLKVNLEDKDGDVLITLTWDKVDGVPTYDVQVFDGEDELVTTNTFGQNVVELKLSELVKKYSIKPGTYTLDWAVRSTDALLKPLSEWAKGPDFEITVKSPGPGTGVDEVQGDQMQSTKVLREGHIYIIVGDKTFDASGRLVK